MNDSVLPSSDHDLLIKVDTKMDALGTRFTAFETGLISRVTKVETRLDAMDIYHAAIPLKDYDSAFHWVEGLRSNLHLILILVGLASSMVGVLISNVISRWLHL